MATMEERLHLPLAVDSINGMVQEAFDNAEAHGFHEDGNPPTPEMLMLIVSEVAEAMEEDRKGVFRKDYYEREDGKPMGFGPELADIIIRVGHLAYAQGVDLEAMVRLVQRFNRTRPHKHGKSY
jgi:NTP pyrophosphatase (non-canonical NTP hydrolase)